MTLEVAFIFIGKINIRSHETTMIFIHHNITEGYDIKNIMGERSGSISAKDFLQNGAAAKKI